MRPLFFRTIENEELLAPAASDRASTIRIRKEHHPNQRDGKEVGILPVHQTGAGPERAHRATPHCVLPRPSLPCGLVPRGLPSLVKQLRTLGLSAFCARGAMSSAKRQQVLVDLVLERRDQTVWGAVVELQDRALDYLVLAQAREGVRPDLGVGPRGDGRRYVELHQVLVLIRFGERSEEHTSELQSPLNILCRL